jgi:coenzyme F420-0:L-glutamate ligase/coenzyme F420-1:gamma-L-glutamate ligase
VTPESLPPATLEILALTWPEVLDGDDLTSLLLDSCTLRDGDVVTVTSKVVSKAEGRAVAGQRAAAIEDEAVRVLARRGESVIAETRHGLVLAAAGVDASNIEAGYALLLPVEPDASARRIREQVRERVRSNVAVVVTDTAGRAWRNGQIDLAIGCAGLSALMDLSGATDGHGNTLVVTAPATADEVASAADLVKGKLAGRPAAVLRGLGDLVLPIGEHGPGAAELIRPSNEDLFGLGAREAAVAAALRTDPVALDHFPPRVAIDPAPFTGVVSERPDVRIEITEIAVGAWRVRLLLHDDAPEAAAVHAGRLWERCAVLAAAHRLEASTDEVAAAASEPDSAGWHGIASAVWFVG